MVRKQWKRAACSHVVCSPARQCVDRSDPRALHGRADLFALQALFEESLGGDAARGRAGGAQKVCLRVGVVGVAEVAERLS